MTEISAPLQSIALPQVFHWAPEHFAESPRIPLINAADVERIFNHLDLWDCWPLAHEDGRPVMHGGRQWWFFLSAPVFPDPIDRHAHARIRLLSFGNDGWCDHGNAFPDGLTPGSREWAGSAVLMDDGQTVQHFITAAGRRNELALTFEQRLFVIEGTLGDDGPGNWQTPREIFMADGVRYLLDRQDHGAPGQIKGFRDPAWLRDPVTGKAHILFTGSDASSSHTHTGNIGIATLDNGAWVLGDPVVDAVGVNNELERPHVVVSDGRYYLFWSTQRHVFAPEAVAGPNGLYGVVADAMTGPWRPINGSGLVAANPDAEPAQSYSWWVTGEGEVWSFVDYFAMAGRSTANHQELLRSNFGGTPAPRFKLRFNSDAVTIG